MSAVQPFDSTVNAIRQKVRRLTSSSSESALSTNDIDKAINTFYNQDFPYAIKIDQMRDVYTFFTRPNIDRYPLDVNFNQGVRAPMYVEGIQGSFFKDRDAFFRMWPRWPTKFVPATGDGTTVSFTFTIPGPFLSKEVVIGTVDGTGTAISVNDDGNGNLVLQIPNPVVSVPSVTPTPPNPAFPGMYNINTSNPGLNNPTNIGTVNYVTGVMAITFLVAPASGESITVWVSQYQTGRPYSLLFWNNEFTIRPIPSLVHKVEIETFLTPVQFMLSTDNPILNQWWQYLAYGASMEILRERQDMDGVENLREGFSRQESLVLERQSTEEIGQRNSTIYSATMMEQGWINGSQGWYG